MGWQDNLVLLEQNVIVDGNNGGQEDPVNCECAAKGKQCNDETCFNFSTQIECVDCLNPRCQNQRMQKKEWAKMDVRETPMKHGYGLFAGEDMKEGQLIVEFLGEVINNKTMRARGCNGAKQLYLHNIAPNTYLDATQKGSIARFTNHSCEPNVKHERWIVNGNLCIGVFALKDLKKGEELGFDYHWKFNRQKPTRCHCGAETCRGFIEELSDELKQFFALRKGVWRKAEEALQVCKEDDGECRGDLPKWLLDKRVRIFWPGNNKFWDANVEKWDAEKKIHSVFYTFDGKNTTERLLLQNDPSQCNPALEWQWLDETQEDSSISKKTPSPGNKGSAMDVTASDEEEDVVVVDSGDMRAAMGDYHASGIRNSAPRNTDRFMAPPKQKLKQRVTAQVLFSTAQYVVLESLKTSSSPVKFNEEKAHDESAVYDHFVELLKAHCKGVRCQILPPATRAKSSSARGMDLLLFGDEDVVANAQEMLSKSAALRSDQAAAHNRSLERELSSNQGLSLVYDWRIFPTLVDINARAAAHAGDSRITAECIVLQNMWYAMGADKSLFDLPLMCSLDKVPDPRVASALLSGKQGISDSTKTVFLGHMRSIGQRLNCFAMTILHASTLLLRYLTYSGATDSIMRDTTPIIAACVMLAEKARGNFSPGHLRRIVTAAYCAVFNRSDNSVGDMSTINESTVAMEGRILSILKNDVTVGDVLPPVYRVWCEIENHVNDIWIFDKHCGGLSNCGSLGVAVATSFPTFWQALPTDVATLVTLIVDCIACESAEQILYSSDELMPRSIFLAFWHVASISLRLPLKQLVWLINNMSGLCAVLPESVQPSWFADMQKEAEKRGRRLSWQDIVQGVGVVVDRWLKQGELLDHTFHGESMSAMQHNFSNCCRLRFPWLSSNEPSEIDVSKTESNIWAFGKDIYSAKLPESYMERLVNASAIRDFLDSDGGVVSASLRSWPTERSSRKEMNQLKAANLEDSSAGCGVSASAIHELALLSQVHCYSAIHLLCGSSSNDKQALDNNRCPPPSSPYVMDVVGIATLPGRFELPRFSKSGAALGPDLPSTRPADSPVRTNNANIRYGDAEEAEFLRSITLGSSADSPRTGGSQEKRQCFLVTPQYVMNLDTLLSNTAKKMAPLPPLFALDLCRDIFSAVQHLQEAGVVLKWLDPSYIYIKQSGRLVLGGLAGAAYAGGGSFSSGIPTYITTLERARDKERQKLRQKNKRSDERRRHKRSRRDDDEDDHGGADKKRHKNSDGSSSSSHIIASAMKGVKVAKPSLPHLAATAPEIIFGDLPSPRSSVYSAAAVCVYVLSGRYLVKTAESEDVQVQQVFKTLGTPSKEATAHLAYFKELALESTYGLHFRSDDGPKSCRSRVFKSLQHILPNSVTEMLSSLSTVRAESREKEENRRLDEDFSDDGLVLDTFRGCLHLAPQKRFGSALEVLKQRLFMDHSPMHHTEKARVLQEVQRVIKANI